MSIKIGIIGGSGLYRMGIIKNPKKLEMETPFGKPSGEIITGKIGTTRVAFLSRHGPDHTLLPHEINYRANIFALKNVGVERLISIAAVGSMKKKIKPLDIVIPDQIIDRTTKRLNTFFGKNIVVHVGMANPFCPVLSNLFVEKAKEEEMNIHRGTYLCIEGPQFSTKAESNLYRKWGVDVIGMTIAPEAKLAREAEMCFTAIVGVTDFDVWYEEESTVTVSMVMENLTKNNERIIHLIEKVIPIIPDEYNCECKYALEDSIVTPLEIIKKKGDPEISRKLLGRYL